MKKLYMCLIIIFLGLTSPLFASKLTYIDTVDNIYLNSKIGDIKIFNGTIYFITKNNGFYSISDNNLIRLYENEINSFISEESFSFMKMKDTADIAFIYRYEDFSNGVIIKNKESWLKFDSSNSGLANARIFDVIYGTNNEIAITNATLDIGFVNNGSLDIYDCGTDFECGPMPFIKDVGFYYSGCLYYVNSNGNFVKLCDNQVENKISYKEFLVENFWDAVFNSFKIIEEKVFLSGYKTNLLYSIKNDSVSVFQPLSEEKNKELSFDITRNLRIKDFVFGNDGNLYILYSEKDLNYQVPSTAGRSRVIKMTPEFEILEILPIPNEINKSPYLMNIAKDESDINNKKIYINASVGYYVYDPEPTSVENNTETGKPALFIQGAYPNPSNNFVNVKYGADAVNSGKVKMFLSNIMGEKIREYDSRGSYSSTTGYGNCTIDVSGLPTSNYLLVITDGSNYATKNILVVN